MNIIKASILDVQTICEIGKESFFNSHGSSASKKDIEVYLRTNYNMSSLTSEIENSTNSYFLISETAPLGFSNLKLNCSNQSIKIKNIAKLDRIYFIKTAIGKGFGSRLLQFNIDFAKNNQQNGMWLYTWTENKSAINFYKKFGFKIIGNYDFKISKFHTNPNYIMFLKF